MGADAISARLITVNTSRSISPITLPGLSRARSGGKRSIQNESLHCSASTIWPIQRRSRLGPRRGVRPIQRNSGVTIRNGPLKTERRCLRTTEQIASRILRNTGSVVGVTRRRRRQSWYVESTFAHTGRGVQVQRDFQLSSRSKHDGITSVAFAGCAASTLPPWITLFHFRVVVLTGLQISGQPVVNATHRRGPKLLRSITKPKRGWRHTSKGVSHGL